MKKDDYKKIIVDLFNEWKWLLRYIRRYWWGIFLYLVIGVVATVMGLCASVFSKYLVDAVVNHKADRIVEVVALVVGLSVMQIVFQSVSSACMSRVGTRVHNEIRSDFFDKLINCSWQDLSRYHSGDLINRLEGDVSTISSGVINFLPALITRVAQLLGAAAIMFYYDKVMAVLAVIGAPVILLTTQHMSAKVRKYSAKNREMSGKIISEGTEALQNVQLIKAFALSKGYSDKFKKLLEQYRTVKLEYDKFSILTTMIMSFVGLAVSYACYAWGVWRLWEGAITFGTMTMFIQLSAGVTSSFNALVSIVPSLITVGTSVGRIMELFELEEEVDENPEATDRMLTKAKQGRVSIVAKNLSFTYDNSDEIVIKNADFTVKAGENIAIIGPSGEGKTTALRLILGLVKPDEGSISFVSDDGEVIAAGLGTRKLCSYVLQTNNILYGTVADNLRTVAPDATDDELISVLKAAEAWGFVSSLPDGLNAKIGERNNNLSEGQAQRISIARALLRKSPVLLMDEATSSLDEGTEKKVLKNIMSIDPDRICIITTHRPSMLKYCSRIYRIDEDGTVREINKTDRESCCND